MPQTVFISYSHKDEVWKNRLVKHLNVLEQQDLLRPWDDRNIKAGDEWFHEIQSAMAEARVAVLLISPDSLTSQFILHTEVPRLLERRSGDDLAVFPVICEDCLWQEVSWLAKLQVRPKDGKPLESFQGSKRNAELVKIAKEILSIVRNGSSPIRPAKTADAPIIRPGRTGGPARTVRLCSMEAGESAGASRGSGYGSFPAGRTSSVYTFGSIVYRRARRPRSPGAAVYSFLPVVYTTGGALYTETEKVYTTGSWERGRAVNVYTIRADVYRAEPVLYTCDGNLYTQKPSPCVAPDGARGVVGACSPG
jgi:TIR domain-containing protein